MNHLSEMNALITSANDKLNEHCFKVFLDNKTAGIFEQDYDAMRIFSTVCGFIETHKSRFFSFLEQYESFVEQSKLATKQLEFIAEHIIEYCKEIGLENDNEQEYLLHFYKPFFEALLQKISDLNAVNSPESGVSTLNATKFVEKNIVELQQEIQLSTPEKRLKLLPQLLKIIKAFEQLRSVTKSFEIQKTAGDLTKTTNKEDEKPEIVIGKPPMSDLPVEANIYEGMVFQNPFSIDQCPPEFRK